MITDRQGIEIAKGSGGKFPPFKAKVRVLQLNADDTATCHTVDKYEVTIPLTALSAGEEVRVKPQDLDRFDGRLKIRVWIKGNEVNPNDVFTVTGKIVRADHQKSKRQLSDGTFETFDDTAKEPVLTVIYDGMDSRCLIPAKQVFLDVDDEYRKARLAEMQRKMNADPALGFDDGFLEEHTLGGTGNGRKPKEAEKVSA